MSQGPRGGWVRRLFAGLGMMLVVTVMGCTDIDKPKMGTNTKQPGPGLPGTARLPGQPGVGGVSGQSGLGGTMQPMGNTGTPVGRSGATGYSTGANTNFGTGTTGNSIVPSVGPYNNYQPTGTGPVSPAGSGLGAGSPAGAGTGYATPPGLSDLGPYAPAPPDGRGPVMPPAGGQTPTKYPY